VIEMADWLGLIDVVHVAEYLSLTTSHNMTHPVSYKSQPHMADGSLLRSHTVTLHSTEREALLAGLCDHKIQPRLFYNR